MSEEGERCSAPEPETGPGFIESPELVALLFPAISAVDNATPKIATLIERLGTLTYG